MNKKRIKNHKHLALVTCDRFGRTIVLTQNTWEKIQLIHKEIRDLGEISNTITYAAVICEDKIKSTTENFYRLSGSTIAEEKYSKVSVRFNDEPHTIATAQRVKRVHKQDKKIWP